jgi:mannosyltransferase
MATLADEGYPRQVVSRSWSRLVAMRDVWAAAMAAAASLALGLYQLGQPSLWVDEASTYAAVSRSYGALVLEHHWIYYSLMKPWTALAGTSEVALRLPSVIIAAVACALLVVLGNRLLGRPIGSIAGVVLALNPFVVQWSQQARSYSIVLLLSIVVTAAWAYMRAADSTRRWALYTAALGLFVLVQPLSAGLMAAAQFAAARGFRLRIVMSGVAVVLATSLFLLGVAERDSKGGTLVWNVDPTLGSISHAVVELGGAMGVGVVLAGIGLVVVRRERLLLAAWAVLPLALSIAATPVGKIFVDRYLIVSTPAFALLVAATVDRARGVWRWGALAAFAAGTVAGLALWYSPDGSQNWRGEDWKAATTFAMRHGGATPYPAWTASPPYRYYGGVERKTGLFIIWSDHANDFPGNPLTDISFGKHLRVQQR